MWSRPTIILGVIGILLLVVITVISLNHQSSPKKNISNEVTGDPLPVKFWEEKAFYDGLPFPGSIEPEPPFTGGIIPHHLVAGSLIGELFARLKNQNPKTIILIGPNHYERGDAIVISSPNDWETKFGVVGTDQQILDTLHEKNLVSFNNEVMVEEHSTQGMMPYVSYFTPQAKVVPLILSALITKQELEKLAIALEEYVKNGAIVIAPVDFSHHLTADEASERDKVTLEVIQTKDIDRLLKLKSQYTDSAASIALLIMLMEKTGHGTFTLDHHTNSGELLGDLSREVTSYITGTFR